MSGFEFDGKNIYQLQNLLNNNEDSDSSDDDRPIRASAKLGPSDIGPKNKSKEIKTDTYDKKVSTKDIWNVDEIPEGVVYDTKDDPRLEPEYDISYKQKITTEDVFLQMGNKTPASASCEEMVIKIKLPDEKASDIEIDVTENNFLDCRSTKYRLGLHLPHPVDNKKSNSKWDPVQHTLTVSLILKRELDFLNF